MYYLCKRKLKTTIKTPRQGEVIQTTMKMITKKIENAIEKYPLYSQDGKGDDAKVICKFFNAFGDGTWYVLEGRKEEDGDYTFFGLVEMWGEREYGYFTLSQLTSVRKWGMPCIERDMYFDAKTVGEIN